MPAKDIIDICLKTEALKRLPRTGWKIVGAEIGTSESIASHLWGTSFVSLLIASHLISDGVEVNLERVLKGAVLHDLAESVTSDIPKSAIILGGETAKSAKKKMEDEALHHLFEKFQNGTFDLRDSIIDLSMDSSIEVRIVRTSDILDMLLHATVLEQAGVSPLLLTPFFKTSEDSLKELGIDIGIQIYQILLSNHQDALQRIK